MFTNIRVFELPPSESFIKWVNLLSLYGICYLFTFPLDREWITSPSDFKETLIAVDSLSFFVSRFGLDLFSLSEPAKSTKEIFPFVISPLLLFLASMTIL
jgi:hypothetical protein